MLVGRCWRLCKSGAHDKLSNGQASVSGCLCDLRLLLLRDAAVDDFIFFHGNAFQWCCATLRQHMTEIKAGTIVFATSDCKAGVADARAWLKEKQYTREEVRLYKEGGMVLVQAIKNIQIR